MSKGLVVGTITYEPFGGKYSVSAINKLDNKLNIELSAGSSQWHPFAKVTDDDLKMRGDTFAIEASAGEYLMGRWHIQQGPKWYNGTRPLGFTFRVEPGKVTYLGNIHFVAKEYVNLQDMSERDLPILEARFPAIKTTPMAFAIAKGTKLERLGGEADWGMRMTPLFVPVVPR